MPDTPRPQDASASEPVTDADQETPPTPQGRADDAPAGDGGADPDGHDDGDAATDAG